MRRPIAAAAAAVSVVAVVMALIVIYGVVPLPDHPSLADEPDPTVPGMVAFVRSGCLWTVPAGGGAETQVLCGDAAPGLGTEASVILAWSPGGDLLVQTYTVAGAVVHVVDVQAASRTRELVLGREDQEVERRFHALQQDRAVRDDGARLVWGPELARVDQPTSLPEEAGTAWSLLPGGPEWYSFGPAQWSPDGAWVLVQDSSRRLLLVGSDGSGPRLLALDATGAAWYVPGHDRYTIDVDHPE